MFIFSILKAKSKIKNWTLKLVNWTSIETFTGKEIIWQFSSPFWLIQSGLLKESETKQKLKL